MKTIMTALFLLLLLSGYSMAQEASPHAIDIPPWFANTFLDFREDIADAAKDKKRLFVYFGQDGCPYCKKLMVTNFAQRGIVDKMRRHFVSIALNIWGDRETTWLDGTVHTEKELARRLQVQFTPTILFFDEKGKVVARLNGYYPPSEFERVLDYVAGHHEGKQSLGEYLAKGGRKTANPELNAELFFMRAPFDLRRTEGGKPLAVIFESIDCRECDELHREGFRRPEVRALIDRFDVARFALGAQAELTSPQGNQVSAQTWGRELGIAYTPTIVLFNDSGHEVFRTEAYLRPFHLASALEYVASGAYRSEPSFQRFVQARAERLRQRGQQVDLWQ
jgi:thioredoxin-related protein